MIMNEKKHVSKINLMFFYNFSVPLTVDPSVNIYQNVSSTNYQFNQSTITRNNTQVYYQNMLNYNNGRAFVTNTNNKPEIIQNSPVVQQTLNKLSNVTKSCNDQLFINPEVMKNALLYKQAPQQSKNGL